jgi:hypothetical protein
MQSNIFKTLYFFLIAVLANGCTTSKPTAAYPSEDKALQKFAAHLIGDFSSKKQSETDSTYFNISLSMSRIWEDKKDAIWLYVEQAVSAQKNKPYRQRVYKLTHPDKNQFVSEIYTIRGQENFVGLQHDAQKRQLLRPENIELKDGCAVTMYYQNGIYQGGTDGAKCPSDLRGAKYATTKITLKKDLLESWDQGFDASGKQVWGATKGGYQFIRE